MAGLAGRQGWDVRTCGLPPDAARYRILCPETTASDVEQSAARLGLGSAAIVRVAVDDDDRLDVHDLGARLADLRRRDLPPVVVVAAAGAADRASIDPLPEVAARARAAGAWLHVDASRGGALLFSERHGEKLRGGKSWSRSS
jgi:L-2,4-diaminobutyrate decarboxylase